MNTAELLFFLAQSWLTAGAVVAALFLTIGIDRIDPDARGAYVFRPLLIPGVLLIWPLVLWRWWVLETGRDRPAARHSAIRGAHGPVTAVMAAIIVLAISLGWSVRQNWPSDVAPERLSAAGEASQ